MAIDDKLRKELIGDLLVESNEGLDRFDRSLLELENGQGGVELMNDVFRVIHTIKGTAGCLGLGKIEKVAHAGENLLSMIREGTAKITRQSVTVLLALSDALRNLLREVENTGTDGDIDHSELLVRLDSLQRQAVTLAPDSETPDASNVGYGLFAEEEELISAGESRNCDAETKDTVDVMEIEGSPKAAPETSKSSNEIAPRSELNTKGSLADNAIRVDIAQLDKLMNLVGELVLARNQILANAGQQDPAALVTASQRLNIITTELQEGVMKTRMQPIGNVWGKFPRIVRDVSHDLNKRVRLVMDGQSTELDRTIVEAIKDPLTHIIRNSIDHGIEPPEVRAAAGKSAEGLLSLRAYHEGGQVNIEIMDDGAGINVEKVRAKAISMNLIATEKASRLTERELLNLVFLPGLSTAAQVTNLSGRGVGMDVVKTNIEKIGGSLDLQSQPGQGTCIKIKIPLTLAIIPALIVTSGNDRYAIPQASLLELVRLEGSQARKGIESLYGAPVYRLRGRLLPLVHLNEQLKVPGCDWLSRRGGSTAEDEVVNIVVLQADGRQFGLVVDAINDTEEIVVKPLGKQLKGIACFAGATIMGDGRVALILDVVGLAQHAHVVTEGRDARMSEQARGRSSQEGDAETLLVFDVGRDRRMAIPLEKAARLEDFPVSKIERAGSQEVIQYRGQILPLIRVADYLPGNQSVETNSDTIQVVVCSEGGRSHGLVVGRINDIVEEFVQVKRIQSSQGILGSVVVQDRVTDLLDVAGVIRESEQRSQICAAA